MGDSLLLVKKLKGNELKGLKFIIRYRWISVTPGSVIGRCNCTNIGAKGISNHRSLVQLFRLYQSKMQAFDTDILASKNQCSSY